MGHFALTSLAAVCFHQVQVYILLPTNVYQVSLLVFELDFTTNIPWTCTNFSHLAQTTIFALGRSVFPFIWSLLQLDTYIWVLYCKACSKDWSPKDMLQVSLKPQKIMVGRDFCPTSDILYVVVFKWCYDAQFLWYEGKEILDSYGNMISLSNSGDYHHRCL